MRARLQIEASLTDISYSGREGLLAGYAPDIMTVWRHAADFVDRILKGAKSGRDAGRAAQHRTAGFFD
jgi:hypothetical protein